MPQFKCAMCGRDFKTHKSKQTCCSKPCQYKLRGIQKIEPLEARFWRYVEKTDSCWLWVGSKKPNGYGQLTDNMSIPKVSHLTHRFSWELHNGPIPEGLFVCHKCDVKQCVNPDHLFLGTAKDNMADFAAKGKQRKGQQINTCKLTPDQVLEARQRMQNGECPSRVAIALGLNRNAMYRIRDGLSWKHL